MNGIEQFIAEQIAGEMVRIKRISPMVKSYGSNARGFLESLEGEGWSIRDYNVCVRALAFIAEQNGCYNRSAEQAEVEEDPIRLLPWYQGKEKKPWFGPDNISNHSIEKTEDLVVLFGDGAKKSACFTSILGGGYIILQERINGRGKNIIYYRPADCFSDGVVGIAGGPNALVTSSGDLFLDISRGLHELGHRLLDITPYQDLKDNFRHEAWCKLGDEKGDELVDEAMQLEEGFVENEVYSVLGISSHLLCLYENCDKASLRQIEVFLRTEVKKLSDISYSVLASLFSFLCEHTQQKPIDYLKRLFQRLSEELDCRQAIETTVGLQWDNVFPLWAGRVSSSYPVTKLLRVIFGEEI